MRSGLPSSSISRSSGPCGIAERRALQRRVRRDWPAGPFSGSAASASAGIRRLVAEAARALDRAEQHLQHMQHPAGLEAVGVGRDAAHGVHRHRAADGLVVAASGGVGPRRSSVDRSARTRRAPARAAMRRIVSAGMPHSPPATVRASIRRRGIARRSARSRPALRPSGSFERRRPAPARYRCASHRRTRRRMSVRSASGLPSRVAREQSVVGARPASAITSQCALVKRTRYSRSTFRARISSWISAPTNKPSVPGRMPIHSSAIAP